MTHEEIIEEKRRIRALEDKEITAVRQKYRHMYKELHDKCSHEGMRWRLVHTEMVMGNYKSAYECYCLICGYQNRSETQPVVDYEILEEVRSNPPF